MPPNIHERTLQLCRAPVFAQIDPYIPRGIDPAPVAFDFEKLPNGPTISDVCTRVQLEATEALKKEVDDHYDVDELIWQDPLLQCRIRAIGKSQIINLLMRKISNMEWSRWRQTGTFRFPSPDVLAVHS